MVIGQSNDIQTVSRDYVRISGSFLPNGSNAVANASNTGVSATVTRVSAGLFDIQFSDSFADYVSFNVWASFVNPTSQLRDQILQIVSYTPGTRTITIRVWDISGAAVDDIASNAANRIYFSGVARMSGGI